MGTRPDFVGPVYLRLHRIGKAADNSHTLSDELLRPTEARRHVIGFEAPQGCTEGVGGIYVENGLFGVKCGGKPPGRASGHRRENVGVGLAPFVYGFGGSGEDAGIALYLFGETGGVGALSSTTTVGQPEKEDFDLYSTIAADEKRATERVTDLRGSLADLGFCGGCVHSLSLGLGPYIVL